MWLRVRRRDRGGVSRTRPTRLQEHTVNRIQPRRLTTVLASTSLVSILVIGFGSLPASARQDAGPGLDPSAASTSTSCPLQRVDDQFVACDNLTGNGVAAPGWVEQR